MLLQWLLVLLGMAPGLSCCMLDAPSSNVQNGTVQNWFTLRACDVLRACLLCQVDRPSVTEQQCNEVQSNLFDLFAHLGATDDQLDFTTLYASAREVSAKAGPF